MRAKGDGTLLLTTGVSPTVPAPFLTNVGLATAALRNWAHTLHAELRAEGIHVGTMTIAFSVAFGVVPGGGEADPDAIGDLDTFRAFVAQYGGAPGEPATSVTAAD
ncbi:hypothetical protein [Streptosporangium sp. V21-05]|uniref:hypothetical protein n=1 Tax=Streptosporangium sp. V21-05 TaxID=3446115 RepID=UPI003F535FD4